MGLCDGSSADRGQRGEGHHGGGIRRARIGRRREGGEKDKGPKTGRDPQITQITQITQMTAVEGAGFIVELKATDAIAPIQTVSGHVSPLASWRLISLSLLAILASWRFKSLPPRRLGGSISLPSRMTMTVSNTRERLIGAHPSPGRKRHRALCGRFSGWASRGQVGKAAAFSDGHQLVLGYRGANAIDTDAVTPRISATVWIEPVHSAVGHGNSWKCLFFWGFAFSLLTLTIGFVLLTRF